MRRDRRTTHGLITLKEDDATTLVTRCKVVSRVVELDGRYDIG